MLIKEFLSGNIVNLTIKYSEWSKINDIDYLVNLFAVKAIEEKLNLQDLLIKFTKGENDLFKILKRRFEKNFDIEIENFLNRKEKILSSKKIKRKYIEKEKYINNVLFFKDLNKFYYQNGFFDESNIKDIFFKSNEDNKFESYNLDITKDTKLTNFDLILKNETLDEFNIENLKGIKNKLILEKIISKANNNFNKLLPNFEEINYFKKAEFWNSNFKEITRNYKKDANFNVEIINIEDKIINDKVEFNLNTKEILIFTFFHFKSLPFILEKKLKFSEYRKDPLFNNFLSKLSKVNKELNKKFIDIFIEYADTKEELIIIKDKLLKASEIINLLPKVNLMIKYNFDLIKDIFLIINIYDEVFSIKNVEYSINYYKYINNFYPRNWDMIDINKKMFLLNKINKSNENILTKEDKNILNSYNLNLKNIYKDIKIEINKYNNDREYLNEVAQKLTQFKKLIENSKKPFEKENYFKKREKLFKDIEYFKREAIDWKNLFNFYIHLSNTSYIEKYKVKESKIKYYKFLKEIKDKFVKTNIGNIDTYTLDNNDLSKIREIDENYLDFKSKLNSFYSKLNN